MKSGGNEKRWRTTKIFSQIKKSSRKAWGWKNCESESNLRVWMLVKLLEGRMTQHTTFAINQEIGKTSTSRFLLTIVWLGKYFCFETSRRERRSARGFDVSLWNLNFASNRYVCGKYFSEGINVKRERERKALARQTLARVWIWLILRALNFFWRHEHYQSVNNMQSGINWLDGEEAEEEQKFRGESKQISIFLLAVWR